MRSTSLNFRVDGLAGLAEAFRRTQGSKDAAAAGALLASQAERLTASDVVWDDLFKEPSVVDAARGGDHRRRGARLELRPDARSREHPLDGADLGADQRLAASGSTGGTPSGLHGTNIEQVTVVPGGQVLSESAENTVEASTDLAFAVAVANGGDSQEVKIEVTLTIQQSPTPIVKKQTIDIINPDETKTVVFRDFPSVDFGERRIMRIDVDPVPARRRPTTTPPSSRSSSRWERRFCPSS